MATIALRYDLRLAPFAETTHADLYRICLEQVAWAEANAAADIVVLSEHHAMPDGFMPSPFTLAAAIVARTERIPVSVAAALLPLHDPIRLAEQIATVDLIARGRVSFVAGAGYTHHEFEMAGVDRKRRGKLVEEHIEVMRKAWTGEPFEYQGRTVRVTPRPFSQPHPPIFMGGAAEPAARRAARLRLAFFPSTDDPAVHAAYLDECAKVGFEGFALKPKGPAFVHIAEDPDKAWAEIGRYLWYDADSYRSWQADVAHSSVTTDAADIDALRAEGKYRVVTPDECVTLYEELGHDGTIVLHPLICGLPPDLGWSSLELFRSGVLPRARPPA